MFSEIPSRRRPKLKPIRHQQFEHETAPGSVSIQTLQQSGEGPQRCSSVYSCITLPKDGGAGCADFNKFDIFLTICLKIFQLIFYLLFFIFCPIKRTNYVLSQEVIQLHCCNALLL